MVILLFSPFANTMISARGLQFSYQPSQVFKYPDIQCNVGETLLVQGASGCGKSTLLHLLAGLMKPSSGSVIVNGTDLCQLNNKKLDVFRGKEIGIITQRFHFIESVSVEDNIRAAGYFSGKPVDEAFLKAIILSLKINTLMDRKPLDLSIGEQQRVCIARAVVNRPSLLLADEPTSSLDDKNCQEVARILSSLAKESGAALIIVTHDERLKRIFPHQITLT